jgi:ABC-type transport system involved in cytochrome c biogenesis permease subunit
MATTLERTERPLPQIQKQALSPKFLWGHVAGMVLFGVGIIAFTIINFSLVFETHDETASESVALPADYDYTIWRNLVVQHGARLKPFETAAQEVCREITSRNRVHGYDAVPVVLSWMLEGNPRSVNRQSRWDDKKFILCEHQDVRRFILLLNPDGSLKPDNLTHEQVHGKFMSPKELREFVKIFVSLKETKFGKLREISAHLPESELSQVERRLNLYQALRYPQEDPGKDPFAFVSLDKVPGAPWFSLGQLRQIQGDSTKWYAQMKERVKDAPQLYLNQEQRDSLAAFQKKLEAGQGKEMVDALRPMLDERRAKEVADYAALRADQKTDKAHEFLAEKIRTWPTFSEAKKPPSAASIQVLNDALAKKATDADEVAEALGQFLAGRDAAGLAHLEDQLPKKRGQYAANKPEFRMLHMTYLEMRFPDLYQTAVHWQSPPQGAIDKVIDKFEALCDAYDSNDAGKFQQASEAYFATLKEVSEQQTGAVYPGDDTIATRLGHLLTGNTIDAPSPQLIDLELTFNRTKPFMWAWILMLGSMTFLCLSLGLNSRICYIGGFAIYLLSLAFQAFGFFTRIVVSGRPPVTNMYETVIWVAFMTGIFALILEGIYRRKVIALAGSFVATLGLVLADQLPLALDPKITSLVPVLRSNFWLTIHVLTIVSSYAAGALAWALGNISLVMIIFGRGSRDTVKMLSNFTYRALQIAVLLLAAGTFLGGWWAAYSWGRFWGWDPKENGALIALLCYVIPLHMRFIGWIKDFGLAIAGIVCFAAIMISWYGVNFIFPAGLHAYGFGGGGATWVYWAACINLEWVFIASLIYRRKQLQALTLQSS